MAFLLSNIAAQAAEERKKKQQSQTNSGGFALTNAASEAAAARQASRTETSAQQTPTTKQQTTIGKSGSILGVPFNAPEDTIPGTSVSVNSKRGEALAPVIDDVQKARAYFEDVRQNPAKYAGAENADEIRRQSKEIQAYLENAGQYINAVSGMKSDTQYEDYLRAIEKAQSWYGLDKNEDYEQQSQYAQKYIPGTEEQQTILGKNGAYGYYSRTGSEDIIYDYVNRRYMSAEDAARVNEIVAMNDMAYGQTHGGWNELPEDVVKTFDYLYATRGQDEAYDYLNSTQSQGMTAEGAFAWGLVQGVGAPSIAAAIGSAYGEISGDEDFKLHNRDTFNELAQLYGEAKEEYPGITGAGQTAGNLMLMSLIGQGAGAIGSAAAGAGETAAIGSRAAMTATNIARQTASNALTWVISDAVHNAGALSTGNMSGESFARSLGVSAASGAAGSLTQGLVETGLASVLTKNGLMTPFAEFVRQTTAGTASAGAYVGTSYALSEEKPSNDELATQLVTAFAFALIGGISRSIATTEADAAAFEQATDAIAERYRQLSENLNSLPPEERARAAQEIITETQALRQSLNSRYIAGQQENVNNMNAALNMIEQTMNGYIEGYAYAQNASTPQTALPGSTSTAMTVRPTQASADSAEALAIRDTVAQTLQTAMTDGLTEGETTHEVTARVSEAVGNAPYEVRRDANGNVYIDISEDILAGQPESEWRGLVRRTIQKIFGDGLQMQRGTVYTNRKGRGEYSNGSYTRMLERTDPEMYTDKLRMAAGSDGIVANAENYTYEDANPNRTDNIVGFNRGNIVVSIKNRGYSGDVLNAIYSDGREVFFDIGNLARKEITRAPSPERYADNGFSLASDEALAKPTIAQPAPSVNPQLERNAMAAMQKAVGNSFGKAGAEAAMSAYDPQSAVGMNDYLRDFARTYNAALEGKTATDTVLTAEQYNAAIQAANADRTEALQTAPANATMETEQTAQPAAEVTLYKQAQLEALQNADVTDEWNEPITSAAQIKTYAEAVAADRAEFGSSVDFDIEAAEQALSSGEITVYSPRAITVGSFVTPSRVNAEDMAGGGGRIYSMTVPLDAVAWTDAWGGQYTGEMEDINNGRENGLDTRSAGDISQRTGESGRAVSEGSEGARGERGAGSPAQRTGRGGSVREVDAQELFREAKPGQTVRTRSEPTERTSNAFRLAEKNGVKDFITFENEIETTTAEKSIRAYNNPSTGQIGVQENNPYVEPDDLARHEIMEHFLDTGKVRVSDIVARAAEILGDGGMSRLNQAADVYFRAMKPKGRTLSASESSRLRAHAASELVCDGADHINQLRPAVENGRTDLAGLANLLDEMLDALNGAANELTGGAFELEGELTENKNAAPEKGGELGLGETRFSSKITPSQKRILDLDIAWDPDENSSIKEQLLQHIDEVKNMEPATSVNYDRKTSAPYYKVLDDILKDRFGYKISREDGISFLFDSKAIKSIRQYIESDAEAAAAIAAPYVVKRGKIISGHKHHKGGLYPSITIAAPAALNNNAGITAVTILFADKDRVHSLRVLTPDGKEFELQKNEADPKTSGDLAKARQTISDESASKKTIPQPGESVKTSREIDADYLAAVNSGDMETAQRMVDEAAKAAGYDVKAYHGTNASFTIFDPQYIGSDNKLGIGFYFSRSKLAFNYANKLAVKLKIANPITDSSRDISKDTWNDFARSIGIKFDDINDLTDVGIYIMASNKFGGDKNKFLNEFTRITGKDGIVSDDRNSIVAFNPEQIKSADPVTYDDEGNVIPLSERFNPENEDIRFSSMLDPEALEEQNEQLRKDLQAATAALAKAQSKAEYWEGQTKRSAAPSPDPTDVNRLARELVSGTDTNLKGKDIAPELTELAEFIMRGGDGTEELTFSGVKERAVGIAHRMLENYSELRDSSAVTDYRDIRRRLRDYGTIQVPGNDLPPDWTDWKRRNGWLRVAVSKGTPLDFVYKDLSASYPWIFPEDANPGSDQLYALVDGVRAAEPAYWNPNDEMMAAATEYLANQIIDGIIEDVAQDKTFADRAAKRLSDQRIDAREKLEAQKAKNQAQLDALRAEKNARIEQERERARYDMAYAVHQARLAADERLNNLKAHYKEIQETARARKTEGNMRTRLLKIAKRLQDKKLPTPSRALVNEYVGYIDTVAKNMTGKTRDKLQALSELYNYELENNPDFTRDEAIEKKLSRLNAVRISDLTVEQVQDLIDVLLGLEHQLNNAKRELDSADRRDVYQKGVQIIDDVKGGHTVKPQYMETLDNLFVRNTLSPLREIRRQTGYVDGDPLYEAGLRLNRGQLRMNDYVMKNSKTFDEWVQDKAFMESLTGKKANTIKIRGAGMNGQPVTVEITPDMRISLYLHNKNLQNQKHISSMSGGVKVPDMKLYRAGKIAEAYAKGTRIRLQPSEIRAVCENMTAKERALAERIYKYFNTTSRNALSDEFERLKGYMMRFVEDYFPIDTDGSFTKANAEAINFDGSLEGSGWLKERVVNAKNPIMLYDATSVLLKAIQAHGQFVGLAVPIRDFTKLYGMNGPVYDEAKNRIGSQSVKETIKQTWGTGATDYIDKMLGDLQKTHTESNSWTDLFRQIRSNYAGATLALNLSVALKQAGSYPTAAAVLGWKPLARAMTDFGKVDLDYIASLTPLQWLRSQGYSTPELGDLKAKGRQLPPALNWIQGMDLLTTRKLWKACEYYMQENYSDLKRGSDQYNGTISELYNRVIEETQPNYTVMQRPQLLRSNSELIRDVSMFKTQLFQNFNIFYDAFGNMAAKHQQYQANPNAETKAKYEEAKKNAGRASSALIVQSVVIAAMTLAWNALRGKLKRYKDEEKDKITGWSFAKRFGLDVASGFFGMVPFGSEVFSMISSKLTGEKWYGFEGVTTGALTDFFSTLMSAFTQIGKSLDAAQSGQTAAIQKQVLAWEDIAENTAKVFGVPAENVMNLIKAVYGSITKTACGKYYGEYLSMLATTPIENNKGKYYDLLYNAEKSGNMDQFWEIYNSLVALDAMASEKKSTVENIDAALKQREKKDK